MAKVLCSFTYRRMVAQKKLRKRLEKIRKRIDYINKLSWEREGLIREKRELMKKLKLPY